ncbi:carboxypeptidase-like regulatory domain-containing protein [Flavobacteriaceae bacterium R38]|nr:carboxypeptidase-like regulatory domain-containing protein [Flavobacteriaceae bacterium R38]
MKKITTLFAIIFIVINYSLSHAQTISSKIVDSTSKKPIPYVTIQLSNKKGVITNEEGRFTLLLGKNTKATDSLFISCIGYESIGRPLNQFTDSIIYLRAKAIELNSVTLTNKEYTPEEIIAKVKENMQKNYNFELTKKRLFFRESFHSNLVKSDYTFKKSTIEELNKKFLDSVIETVPKRDDRYTEILCDLYGNYDREKQKINLIKASELYDKNSDLDLTALEEKFNQIIKSNVKPDSYFKIKSGLFGTKVEADELFDEEVDSTDTAALKKELEERKKREEERKKNFAGSRRSRIGGAFQNLFFMENTNLNMIRKSKKYEFTLLDYTYLGDNPVYVLEFEPKRGADYKGKLYVNTDDFAIIRLDYENVKPLRKFGLLGISYREYLANGKMIFSKDADSLYNLSYFETEKGTRFGIRRPLKIIEKNKHVKGRRKQNELSVKIDMAVTNVYKYEIVVFNTENLSASKFETFKENNSLLPTYMPAYNPEFWQGYNIIEPNQAIKEFTAK